MTPEEAKPDRTALGILHRVLEIPDESFRAQVLDEACGGDESLKARVTALFAHAVETDVSAEPGASPDSVATMMSPSVEQAGEHIGHYKLLQQIGEGGFGTVWMAEQVEPVSRRVALKIIKLGMDTREVIARFEAERQALAMMDHPNIARVLDAGATDKGRPFFVMELVKGIPITQFCDERQLSTRERLALFGDVCAAINHAHQKSVIHRDIKPSNVMVTLHGDKAVVKVIDFGIAKATQGKLTDKTLFTRFEQFIGTPVYMSPEQAVLSGLDIDTRSDIYALGILLYELLTGKPPFDAQTLASAGYEEMRRIIREVEPPKPSSRLSTMAGEERTTLARARRIEPEKLSRMVDPDLDWIVMKAIEKDRARRYETANGLAMDIHRFLSDEPVSATPPSAGYRFRKFARRNKPALRVAAGIAVMLLVATTISTWLAVRAIRAEKLANERLAQVASERDAKDLAREDAETISRFLSDVFRSPDPARVGRTITVAETLDSAVNKLETVLAAQPARRAALQATLARTYYALGLYREAIPLEEKVRDYHRAHSGPEHRDTLQAMIKLALSYSGAGRRNEALQLAEEALTLGRKVLGPEHPDTLDAMHTLANCYYEADRRPRTLQLRKEVLALSRKVRGPEHPDTLAAISNLAVSYSDAGRRDEALKLQEEAWHLIRKMNGREHPETLAAMNNLAIYYSDANRQDEAIRLQEEVLTLNRKVNGLEHPDTLTAMSNLALSYEAAGRLNEALKLREEALAPSRKVLGPDHPDTRSAARSLADSYSQAGRNDDALNLQKELAAPGGSTTASARHSASLPEEPVPAAPDIEVLEASLERFRAEKGAAHTDTIAAMVELARAHGADGSGRKAIKLGEAALALARRSLPPRDPRTIAALQILAGLYRSVDLTDEAAKLEAELEAPDAVK